MQETKYAMPTLHRDDPGEALLTRTIPGSDARNSLGSASKRGKFAGGLVLFFHLQELASDRELRCLSRINEDRSANYIDSIGHIRW
jgi:hypothetical protein